MHIILTTEQAQRIVEILSDLHDEQVDDNPDFAKEIDSLCGALQPEGDQTALMDREAIDEPCQKLNFGSNAGVTPAEVDALLKQYRELHDGLSEMVESGRLAQADIPDDYEWLVERMLVPIASHPGQAAID